MICQLPDDRLSETQSSDSKQEFAFDLRFLSAYYGIERSRYPRHICDTFVTFIRFIYVYKYIYIYIYIYTYIHIYIIDINIYI